MYGSEREIKTFIDTTGLRGRHYGLCSGDQWALGVRDRSIRGCPSYRKVMRSGVRASTSVGQHHIACECKYYVPHSTRLKLAAHPSAQAQSSLPKDLVNRCGSRGVSARRGFAEPPPPLHSLHGYVTVVGALDGITFLYACVSVNAPFAD